MASSRENKNSAPLTVREDADGNVRMDANQRVLKSVDDLVTVLRKGNKRRACASTEKNNRSSRSHAIFQVMITLIVVYLLGFVVGEYLLDWYVNVGVCLCNYP